MGWNNFFQNGLRDVWTLLLFTHKLVTWSGHKQGVSFHSVITWQ